LPKLLGELKAAGVKSAEFHDTGRLAAVEFGPTELPDAGLGAETEPDSPLTASARKHLTVLRRGQAPKETA
jgi:hypothetical protein